MTELDYNQNNSVTSLEQYGLEYFDLNKYKPEGLISSSNFPVICYQNRFSSERIAVKVMKANSPEQETEIIKNFQRI